MKTTLLIPALNEIVAMREILPRIKRDWVDQILLVDGNSTDGTADFARQMGCDVYVQKKRGLRFAFMEALDLIKGDVMVTFSPDGNSIPELIPPLLAKMREGYDMVIASRYADGAKSYDDDFVTAFGNWFFTKSINLLHGGHYTDAMVMLRAYKKEVAYICDLHKDSSFTMEEKLFCTTVGWEPLLSIRAAKKKLRIAEIPGDEPPRLGGERKLQVVRWGAAYYFEVLREKFIWK